MKPFKSILDRSFVYVPSNATSVDRTWRRFGWRPATELAGSTERSRETSAKAASKSLPAAN